MLETQNYLQNNTLASLCDRLAIKTIRHRTYSNLVLLTYDQLESPKLDPIVCECRGLILDEADNWNVVCYPYKRFFNYGEHGAAEIDWSTAAIQEKLDGTLICMYYYDYAWHISTKGTPDASGNLYSLDMSINDFVWELVYEKGYNVDELDTGCNYFFELVSPYQQHIVRQKESKLVLHGVRDRNTLLEKDPMFHAGSWLNLPIIQSFDVHDIDYVLEYANSFEGTKCEGLILVDDNFNRVKVKSPHYVALSHLSDPKITEKSMVEIVRRNESDEFLTYFPEYADLFHSTLYAYQSLCAILHNAWEEYGDIKNQKEFAIAVADVPCNSILFSLRSSKVQSIRKGLEMMNVNTLKDALKKL